MANPLARYNYIKDFGIPQAAIRVDAKGINVTWRQLILESGETLELEAANQIYFVVESEIGLRVSSENGKYEEGSDSLEEQQIEHTRKVVIQNFDTEAKEITLLHMVVE